VVRAQARYEPAYWLDIAGSPETTLKAVDVLLRREWLECCGHLSAFTDRGRRTIGKGRRIGDVLGSAGDRLDYVYDFGSSTELTVSHLAVIRTAPNKRVRAVARNAPPSWQCAECGAAAVSICADCASEGDGAYCGAHAEGHPCGEEMLLPVVNSPRIGVCAYSG
jgi:hypothetical protein